MNDTSRRWRRRALALCNSLAVMGGAWAAPSDAERIAELERKLDVLTQRLLQIEGGRAAPQPTAAAPAATATLPDAERVNPIAPGPVGRRFEGGIPLHAFVDAGFARDTPDPAGRKGGFVVGNLDLYMTPSYGERIKSIIELVFEQDEQGHLAIDLERLQLGYTFGDALTGWIGRFHTPFGYWNAAFHHGAQIQTSILRPRFLSFEDQGGIMPVHGVGLLGSGSLPAGGGRLKYDVFIANGTPIVDGTLTISGFKDDNKSKMVGANLRHEFGSELQGLTLGVHALTAGVGSYDVEGTLQARTRLNVGGVFGVLERQNWELIGEYYAFRNRDLSGATGTHASWAGLAQVGYTLSGGLTPYARYEKASLNQNDSYFSTLLSGRSYRRDSVGLRYELDTATALKLEFGRTRETQADGDVRSNGVRGQVATRF